MQIGISTACLYPMETGEALQTLLDAGFRRFEIFLNTHRETLPGYVQGLREQLERYGATVASVHPFTSSMEGMLLFSEYGPRTQDGMDFYEQYARAAQQLGAKWVVLHGQRPHSCGHRHLEPYAQRYAQLDERMKPYGVRLAQENVNGFLSQNPGFVRALHGRLGAESAFVLDLKQAVRAGFDPYDMARAMGGRLVHVHLNDHNARQDCLVPGQGEMDYARLFHQLAEQGFPQDMVLEVYRSNFSAIEELQRAKEELETLLARMGR